MAQYIDKSALVSEIERRIGEIDKYYCDINCVYQRIEECKGFLSFLDALEVKEVDLEDSIKETLAQNYVDYIFKRHDIDSESKEGQLIYYAYIHGMNQCLTQLRAQKGE